jgi:hypothetical protein
MYGAMNMDRKGAFASLVSGRDPVVPKSLEPRLKVRIFSESLELRFKQMGFERAVGEYPVLLGLQLFLERWNRVAGAGRSGVKARGKNGLFLLGSIRHRRYARRF